MTGSGQDTHGFRVKEGQVAGPAHGLDALVPERGLQALVLLPWAIHPVLWMDGVVLPGEEGVSNIVAESHQHNWKREKTKLGNLFGQ